MGMSCERSDVGVLLKPRKIQMANSTGLPRNSYEVSCGFFGYTVRILLRSLIVNLSQGNHDRLNHGYLHAPLFRILGCGKTGGKRRGLLHVLLAWVMPSRSQVFRGRENRGMVLSEVMLVL